MMGTDLRCWWQNHYVDDFFRYVGDFLNVLNYSPQSESVTNISNLSPTSVTNINVTVRNTFFFKTILVRLKIMYRSLTLGLVLVFCGGGFLALLVCNWPKPMVRLYIRIFGYHHYVTKCHQDVTQVSPNNDMRIYFKSFMYTTLRQCQRLYGP